MFLMSVTELVSQLRMSWLKSLAYYSTAMGGWPRGVSVNASRGRATEKKEWGGPRTLNIQLMVVTELVSQLPMGWLKALAFYITATGGWPRGVSVNASRGRATEKKEWGGPRTWNMFLMSVTELVSQLPMGWLKALAFYSTATGGWPRGVSVNASRGRATERKEWGGPRTKNMLLISVTELVTQLPMSWLKSLASYSTATGGWPRGVSVNASRGRATEKKEWGGPRTWNMLSMVVTELVSQLPMGWLKAEASYITATDGWPRGVSVNASRGRVTEKK